MNFGKKVNIGSILDLDTLLLREAIGKWNNYILKNGCGSRIWTYDLQVMSLTSYRAAPSRVVAYLVIIYTNNEKRKIKFHHMQISTHLLTFLDIIVSYIRNNLRNEQYNLILWFPVLQCAGILTYFSLSFEPSCISIFLLLFTHTNFWLQYYTESTQYYALL